MPDQRDDIVVTGVGLACNLGDDTTKIAGMLRRGETIPFEHWDVAEKLNARCRIIGKYHGDITDAALGIKKPQARFMGRAARIALKVARAAIADSGRPQDDLAVVFGSGTGDVATHIEVHEKLAATSDTKKLSPTVIPRLMASTISANLVHVLETRGPSFSATPRVPAATTTCCSRPSSSVPAT